MEITFDITIYELIFLILTTIGGFFALFQWQQGNKIKRAELLKEALTRIRDDEEFASVLYDIDYGVEWYTVAFVNEHTREQKFDKVFAYFDYLCYLKNKHILSKSEFRIFEYRITRMVRNDSFLDYMFNLYHFSKRNQTDMSFHHLLTYLRKNNLLNEDFWDVHSRRYKKLLNI